MSEFIMGFITIIGGVFTGVVGFALIGGLVALMIVPTIGLLRRSHKPQLKRRVPGYTDEAMAGSARPS